MNNIERKYQCVFFDLDATLWNFHKNSQAVLKLLFERYKLQTFFTDFDEFYQLYSAHNDYLWMLYAQGKIKRSDLEIDRFKYPFEQKSLNLPIVAEAMRDDYLPELVKQTALEKGAKEILDYLSDKNYRLFIVSNGFREVQYKKLEAAGISSYFEKVFLSEEIGASKPDRLFFETALKFSKADRAKTIVIGDNYQTDIKGAMDSGLDCAYYNTSGLIYEGPCPTYEIKSLDELRHIL